MQIPDKKIKIYYVANARMPTEKAHGIQIAKMCEAFIEAGVDLTLVVPSRKTTPESLNDFYGLRVPIPLVRLPVPDWYLSGRVGYAVSSVCFMALYTLYLLFKRIRGENFIIYTVDLDNYSSSALTLVPAPLYSEMHGGKPASLMQRMLFARISGVIPINTHIRDELSDSFPFSRATYLVEPNAVDPEGFPILDKKEARKQLSIPESNRIVLYAGRFFAWKGLESIVQAARECKDSSVRWHILGGSKDEFQDIVKEDSIPDTLIFSGAVPYSQVPLWLSAADALLVLGTIRDTQSYYYTSPMKLFEYLLSQRPIVASETPAIRAIVSEKEAFFYKPDDTRDLAEKVVLAISHTLEAQEKIRAASELGQKYTWSGRASRILGFITTSSHAKRT
jgi:glycosyltransferase involved in cell wall biosynthesis